MSFPLEIKARLVAQSVPTASIFIGSRTPLPSKGTAESAAGFLVLRETGGTGPALTQNDTATQRPTMQLMAHAEDAPTARALLATAYTALGGANGLWNITLSSTFYLKVLARQEPTDVGLDPVGRPSFAFNIDAEKQPS